VTAGLPANSNAESGSRGAETTDCGVELLVARAGSASTDLSTFAKGTTLNSRADKGNEQVRIVGWDPQYRADFVNLNEAWVRQYFAMEDADRKQFEDPGRHIVDRGGDIVFVLDGDRCVGACALIACGDGLFELAKMAVLETERGRGLGEILMEGTLRRARELGAHRVFLLSNTSLTPAISLYKKHGFKTVRLGSHPDYERADIEMSIDL